MSVCLLLVISAVAALPAPAQQLPPGQRGQIRQGLPVIPQPGRANLPTPSTPNPFAQRPETNTVFNPRLSLPKSAPDPATMRPFNMDAATAKLLADTKSFSARADMVFAYGPPQARETNIVPLVVYFLDGRLRTDMNLAQIATPQGMLAPPFVGLVSVGVDRIINIVRPDRRSMFLMYPGFNSYTELPLLPEECATTDKEGDALKIARADAGRETMLGQACAKQKVTLIYANGSRHEAMVWFSDELRGFPVQIQWLEPGATVTLRFLQVNITMLEPNLFDAPKGHFKYADQPAMLVAVAQKRASDPRNRPVGVPRAP